ncbi:hypothetical protein Nepgr_003972 [Nepenthes gracilis]|uniref:Uncharacterized protein n=1 Tax=Nepenthes gracilis TaxID=150966 RepID=A0AAD3S0L3_NEPGR|nr:hypothetical protein Nepgr_003972 [Nepenthes gracilis]
MSAVCPSAFRKGFCCGEMFCCCVVAVDTWLLLCYWSVKLLVLATACFLVDLLLLRTADYALLSICLLSGPLILLVYAGDLLPKHCYSISLLSWSLHLMGHAAGFFLLRCLGCMEAADGDFEFRTFAPGSHLLAFDGGGCFGMAWSRGHTLFPSSFMEDERWIVAFPIALEAIWCCWNLAECFPNSVALPIAVPCKCRVELMPSYCFFPRLVVLAAVDDN